MTNFLVACEDNGVQCQLVQVFFVTKRTKLTLMTEARRGSDEVVARWVTPPLGFSEIISNFADSEINRTMSHITYRWLIFFEVSITYKLCKIMSIQLLLCAIG